MSINNPSRQIWSTIQEHFDFNPPTLNTLHEVINEGNGCRLLKLTVIQTNTPTNNEEIDVVITVDGVPILYDASVTGALTDNTEYALHMPEHTAAFLAAYTLDIASIAGVGHQHRPFSGSSAAGEAFNDDVLERRSIKVEVRQTSAIAAGARIRGFIEYQVPEVI